MNIYDFQVKDIHGKDVSLSRFKGKYLLIVNVASECGYTPQYKGLQSLYEAQKDHLEILGFPCNQFGGQEPGQEAEIESFCELNFGVKFPLFSKVDVNGAAAEPLFIYLKQGLPGILGTKDIKWNFTKFLIGPDGELLERFAPNTEPAEIGKEIQKRIATKKGGH